MNHIKNSSPGLAIHEPRLTNPIRHQFALNLIGRMVDVLADAQTVAHGVVTGVFDDAGADKLVVGGTPYDLDQLLTSAPSYLN